LFNRCPLANGSCIIISSVIYLPTGSKAGENKSSKEKLAITRDSEFADRLLKNLLDKHNERRREGIKFMIAQQVKSSTQKTPETAVVITGDMGRYCG
jgi:CRISPR/Cas system endoribonuclease Cas6 (RAMP superfamily)